MVPQPTQTPLFLHQSCETELILSKSAVGDCEHNFPSVQPAWEHNTGQLQKITEFCLPPHIIGLILEKHLFGDKLYHCYAETTCKFPALGKGGKTNAVQRAAMRLSTIISDSKHICEGGIDITA